jgi:AraC-like DNA-binding protein
VVFQQTLSGYGCLEWHGKKYRIAKNQPFIYDLSDPESCYYYPEKAKSPWHFIYCVFANCEKAIGSLNRQNGPVYNLRENNLIARKIRTLLEKHSLESNPQLPPATGIVLCSDIMEMMCLCSQKTRISRGEMLVSEARTFLYEQRDEPFSLKELSQCLTVTPEHLCRVFKKYTGKSPKNFHDRFRIESICEKLVSQDKPLKEIAMESSFEDMSNFSKFFKKFCHATPGEFRKNNALLHFNP